MYYYATNYLATLAGFLALLLFTRPRALLGAACALLALLCLNGPFAAALK